MIFDLKDDFITKVCNSFCLVSHRDGKVDTPYIAYISRKSDGEGGSHIEIQDFSKKVKKKITDFKNLSLKSPTLGYLNLEGTCYYVTRIPHRRWRVGIQQENINQRLFDKYSTDQIGTSLHDNFNKKYPTFDNLKKEVLEGRVKKQAFSRRYALSRQGLEYCGDKVATIDFIKKTLTFESENDVMYHSGILPSLGLWEFKFEMNKPFNHSSYNYDIDI